MMNSNNLDFLKTKPLIFISFYSFLLASICFSFFGCGHPANETECLQILNRTIQVEIEAQQFGSPEEAIKQRKQAFENYRNSFLKKCIGKRITQKAMTCIDQSKKYEEITSCLE